MRALRLAEIGEAYRQAWDEWQSGEDADLWDRTARDGPTQAALTPG